MQLDMNDPKTVALVLSEAARLDPQLMDLAMANVLNGALRERLAKLELEGQQKLDLENQSEDSEEATAESS